jgi:hypothetical protein
MQNRNKPCSECTPNCRLVIAANQEAALLLYWDLFKQGLFPSLCQQHNGTFMVCDGGGREQHLRSQRENQSVRSP